MWQCTDQSHAVFWDSNKTFANLFSGGGGGHGHGGGGYSGGHGGGHSAPVKVIKVC